VSKAHNSYFKIGITDYYKLYKNNTDECKQLNSSMKRYNIYFHKCLIIMDPSALTQLNSFWKLLVFFRCICPLHEPSQIPRVRMQDALFHKHNAVLSY